jgi:hypothetical protein
MTDPNLHGDPQRIIQRLLRSIAELQLMNAQYGATIDEMTDELEKVRKNKTVAPTATEESTTVEGR